MVSSTRTRYAKCGDADIAYQVLGDGPIDLLLYTGGTIPIDCMDEQPSIVRFQRRLASFSRVIRFDVRGVGLSDRVVPKSPPTGEQLVADALAVLDAVGSEKAAVFAPGISSVAGLTLAALHPERLSSLITVNGFARTAWAPDYPHGAAPSAADTGRLSAEPDAVEQGFDLLALAAPSVADDPSFRAWFDRVGNLGATPAMARLIMQSLFEADVRDLLPLIRVPTLILHRKDLNPPFGPGHGRYLGEHIAGAKYVELPGVDLFYWVGESREMLDEIEEFLTGIRGAASERVLATVLFTDIVGSTDRAAQLGDGRWRDLLDRHDETVRTQLQRFRGREVKAMGDGFVATFDSPARAIECALAIRQTLATFDVGVRAGVHTGEIEVRGDDVAGMAVHLGARVAALAAPGEVLVSSTVKDLVVGSSVEFTDRGEHELRGVPGTWRLYAVSG